MRPIQLDYTPRDDSTTYFGSGFTGVGPFTMTTQTVTDGLAHNVSLTSAANLSAITLTVTGLDADGTAQTEAITGPNATTVYGSKYFSKVTSISASGTLGANTMDVGIKDTCISPTIAVNNYQNPFNITMMVDISGTINYSVQYTEQKVLETQPSTLTWFTHATIASKTADFDGTTTSPITAVRLLVNSLTSGATASFTLLQGA